MTEQLYWVVIRSQKRRRRGRVTSVVERIGPMNYTEALAKQASISPDRHHKRFTVQVHADRKAYFAAYHSKRYETDKAYRKTRQDRARDRSRRVRAAARGDMTPWLE